LILADKRGEIVAALLIMQVQDALATRKRKWIPVLGLMVKLLGGLGRGDLETAMPTVCPADEDRPLAETSKNVSR